MIPPKKSKAARENAEEEPTENGDPKAHTSDAEDEPVAPKKSKKPVNIFTEPLVEGKRAKTVSPVEAMLSSWINDNLESMPGMRLQRNQMYKYYLESCANKAVNGVDQGRFLGVVEETFPEGYTVLPNSVYSRKIKEVKKIKKKDKGGVKGETLKIKMKDIITGALQDLGNPKNGVRFYNIKKYIAAHFPALQIDFKPDALKSALNRGVYFGHIILVKGIGKAGFYRLPGKAGDDDEEDKEKAAADGSGDGETKEKKEKKEKTDEDGEDNKDEVKTEGEDVKEEAAEGGKRKKRAAASGGAAKDKKKKKKGKQRSYPKKPTRKFIIHSEPLRVSECFPLAFTYMSEPKQASVAKIKKYVKKYYNMKKLSDRLPKVLEDGLEKGWWSHVSGSRTAGVYRLEMKEYDASADDDLIGMVMNAMVACNDPKVCSAKVIREYITEYHPDLKVAERPYVFKQALLRAAGDGTLKQLTGIGMSGSFQYKKPFMASPVVLQGRDDEDDYDSDGNELIEEGSDDSDSEEEQPDVTVYFDAYVPRPTKRTGHARTSAAGVDLYSDGGSVSTSANRVIPKSVKRARKGGAAVKPTPKKTKKGRRASSEKPVKEEKLVFKTAAARKSRPMPTNSAATIPKKRSRGEDFEAVERSSKRARKNVSYVEEADNEESDDEKEVDNASDISGEEPEEPEEPKAKSKGRKKSKPAGGKAKKGKKSKGKRG